MSSRLGPLFKITGEELTAPADPRAGRRVEVEGRRRATSTQVDERIVAAAGLARFLRQQVPAIRAVSVRPHCR